MTTSTRFDTALEAAWLEFRTSLADLLVDVAVDEEVVVRRAHDASAPWAPLLSFVVTGARRVRCTVMRTDLSADQTAVLIGDGWRRLRDGRVILELGRRRVDEVCAAATDVLREVCDVVHPTFLAPVDASAHTTMLTSVRREPVTAASVSAAHPVADTEHLQELLLDTLAAHADDAFVDADGDIRVQIDTQTIQLRVHPSRPVVEFVACVAAVCVDDRTVNEIVVAEGARWTGVAVHVLDGHVWATQRLVVPTFVATNVIAAIESWRDFLRDGAPAITARIAHAADPIAAPVVTSPPLITSRDARHVDRAHHARRSPTRSGCRAHLRQQRDRRPPMPDHRCPTAPRDRGGEAAGRPTRATRLSQAASSRIARCAGPC